ncbi:hypothetical protein KIN20_035149 [Parelaphostrongylus tenuis]|uniref:Uncharacterized protein n=1 Tax=Parelaphostrongylus tenuis TaxID=148309 RepID=A0AAD5WJQ2_PARTN|nr:hypothetical protein KIN20_035149 [Parelaphostrongylus tenuis]
MPPKRKSRGGLQTTATEGRRTRSSAKKAKADRSESEGSVSSDEERSFDKGNLMSVMRYDYKDLLTNDRFEHPDLIEKLDPKDFNLDYYEKSRLATPLLFSCDPHELGMKMPKAEDFSVDDVFEARWRKSHDRGG